MNIIERAISSVAGGRVLDVATQEGHFVQMLMKNLSSYTEIVGIDVNYLLASLGSKSGFRAGAFA